MATTRLNGLILATARKLKDERTSASSSDDTGHVYSSALLTEYANRAVRDYLMDELNTLGLKAFTRKYPEYVKLSGSLSLTSGSVAKPADALFVFDLLVSDLSVRFDPVAQEDVAQLLANDAGLENASATHPKFFEEAGYIKTLGVTSGNVVARYIVTHPDLVVSITTAGDGVIYTTAAKMTWTAATKLLKLTGEVGVFATDPTNKIILFRTAAIVYIGRVASYYEDSGDTNITLSGDGLPAGNIAAPNIIEFLVSDLWPDGSDLALNEHWHGNIIERMVAMGEADAVRLSQQ